MSSLIFDTHCHLSALDFQNDLDETILRAELAGVQGFALISADAESLVSVKILQEKLMAQYPNKTFVRSSGIHPHDAKNVDDALWNLVLEHEKTAHAIGETGLDYHYESSPKEIQMTIFQKHIDLAVQTQKPLILHNRESREDMLKMLAQESLKKHSNPGVLHCFTEDEDFARKILDLGFYISLSGILTFKNAEQIRRVAEFAPLDRLLIETDSPWLAPMPYRGKRNEPAYCAKVFDFLLQLRKMDAATLSEQLWKNSCLFYGVNNGNS